jgi:glycosyltransferase involved in cell wall biosynthesis
MKFLYFSPIDWNFIMQRPQHLAQELNCNHEVIYIYPMSLKTFLRNVLRKGEKRDEILSARQNINEGLKFYQPLILPQAQIHFLNGINKAACRFRLNRKIIKEKLDDHIVWFNHPHQASYLPLFKDRFICYDCMDNWTDFNLGRERELIKEEENHILSRANVVFASSELLFERMKGKNKHTYLIPNGCDIKHFAQAVEDNLPIPQDIRSLKKPLIGYIGTVAEWHDLELIRFAASERREFNFVLVGPIGTNAEIKPYRDIPNLHFLGSKPYETLPAYLKHMDVCILPFKPDEFAKSIDPVKAYEYLAAGKPVVATDMPELYKFDSWIKIARSRLQFVKFLDDCLEEIKVGKHNPETYRQAVVDHTWQRRAQEIERILAAKNVN